MSSKIHWGTGSYSRDRSICDVFREQVIRTPQAVAAMCNDLSLTYEELDKRSNQFAHFLRKAGVRGEAPVAICLERSVNIPVVILGILKAGGAYVPIDSSYPPERIRFLLGDTAARVVITTRQQARQLPLRDSGASCIEIDVEAERICGESAEELYSSLSGDSLAYIMYTSGSTGVPKGVLVEHRAVVRLVKDTNYAEFGPDEVFLQLAPLSFDASTFEIWGPLLNGGSLALFPPGLPTLEGIGQAIAKFGVTTLWLTAGLFHQMVDHRVDDLKPLRQLLAGGDVLSAAHIRRVLDRCPGVTVINGYGPTESTTFAVCRRLSEGDSVPDLVPIGLPIAHTQVFLLDEQLRPVPEGETGEICIGGDGLARGYLNQAELTAKQFVSVRTASGITRLYRTGDIGKLDPEGHLLFLGRNDRQIKIRGHRVEPAEIEAALRQHPGVRDTVVLPLDEGGNKKLVAYVVPAARRLDEIELRSYLGARLPAHLVPAELISVDKLPLTPNGKVDRGVLVRVPIAPEPANRSRGDNAEQVIAGIWQRVLGLPRVPRSANFFDLGGDSLLLIAVHSDLCRSGFEWISLTDLFAYPNIEDLAAHLEMAPREAAPSWSEMDARAAQRRQMREHLKACQT